MRTFNVFDTSVYSRLTYRGLFSVGSAEVQVVLSSALLGFGASLWGVVALAEENAPHSLKRWVSPLRPSHLSLGAPLRWTGSGGLWVCVFPAPLSCSQKLPAEPV